MKFIRVTMSDSSKWDVAATVVADNRAEYYADKEGGGLDQYNEEFKYAMENDDELIDWATGNMDWDDVRKLAKRVTTAAELDFNAEWINGDKEVVDIE